jgi:hypothetical protein
MAFMFSGLILIFLTTQDSYPIWPFVVTVSLAFIWFVTAIYYKYANKSLRSLLILIDIATYSLFISIVLAMLVGYWKETGHWVIDEMPLIYSALLILSVGYGIYYGNKRWPNKVKHIAEIDETTGIQMDTLYNVFFYDKSAKTVMSPAFSKLVLSAVLLSPVIRTHFDPDAVFRALFIFLSIVMIPTLVSIIMRRYYLVKFYFRRDINIIM